MLSVTVLCRLSLCLAACQHVMLSVTVLCCLSTCHAVCHCVVQSVTVSCSLSLCHAVCHCVVQSVTVSCSLSLCPAVCHCVLQSVTVSCSLSLCRAVCHCVVQSVTVSCSLSLSYSLSLCWVVLQFWRWLASRVLPSSSVSCCLSSEQSTRATPTGRTDSSPLLLPSIGVLQLITFTCCYKGPERRPCILIFKMMVICEFHRCSYIVNLN